MSQVKTKAVVLAAGKGTRMQSSLPKVLHQIFDKPLLGYVLDSIERTGKIDESFVIVGHESEKVESYVLSRLKKDKCILQMPQKGTGDAVAKACSELKGFEGNVLILCGDTPLITEETLIEFLEIHNTLEVDLSVLSAIFNNPTNYGRIVRNSDKTFAAIVEEKDATPEIKAIKEVNAGIYCLNWSKIAPAFEQLECNNAQGEYYLTDIVAWAVKRGLKTQACTIRDKQEIYGINSRSHLVVATSIINERNIAKHLNAGVTIVDPHSTFISCDTEIGEDTIIYPNVYINGKNKVGKNCKIGPFAHLRGDVVIGDNVKIGNFVEVKKSTIADNTNVSHLSYIGDSELGSHVNIGAGTITANYDPIEKTKSRTIIEDGANTGSNTVLVAPVKLEKNSMTGAGSVIGKDIPTFALALTRAPLKIFKGWCNK